LIDTTLLEEEEARLKFSRIEAPQKNLYLKLACHCKRAIETWKCQNYQSTTNKMRKKTQVQEKHNIVQSPYSKPLINNHQQITQNMSIEQQVH
jgi:hypothetical protein